MTRPRPVPRVTVFRHIDVEDALGAGKDVLAGFFPLWVLVGIGWAFAAAHLEKWLAPEGLRLLGKTVLFLGLAVWPLKSGARYALRRMDGKRNPPTGIFALDAWIPFTFTWGVVCLRAGLIGILIDWALTSLILGSKAASPIAFLSGPASVKSIMRLYPVLCLGAILTGYRFVFAPFAALEEGLGFWEALDRGREFARDLGLEILFLFGFMFFPASAGFLLGAVAGGKAFPANIPPYVLYALMFAYAGAIWGQAYRQALSLDLLERGGPAAEKESFHHTPLYP